MIDSLNTDSGGSLPSPPLIYVPASTLVVYSLFVPQRLRDWVDFISRRNRLIDERHVITDPPADCGQQSGGNVFETIFQRVDGKIYIFILTY
jgi:hypothetical protein